METAVYEIEFNDGRTFRVFCVNKNQKKRVKDSYYGMKDRVKEIRTITNGLHTATQYEKILNTL
jgi:hypothetical protein